MSSARDPAGLDPEEHAAHDRFIRAVIRRFVAEPELVEDLAQETWLAALQHSAASRLLGRAWLGTVAQNFVFQALRGKARRLAREAAVARSESVPLDDAPIDPELRRRMLDAVQRLEEPYRTAIHLRFFEDLLPAEIAERLGTRPETVRTRIKRGLARIHASWRARRDSAAAGEPRAGRQGSDRAQFPENEADATGRGNVAR